MGTVLFDHGLRPLKSQGPLQFNSFRNLVLILILEVIKLFNCFLLGLICALDQFLQCLDLLIMFYFEFLFSLFEFFGQFLFDVDYSSFVVVDLNLEFGLLF